jgi:hypothetical protein
MGKIRYPLFRHLLHCMGLAIDRNDYASNGFPISLTTGLLAKSPSMRRPVSVKSDFVRSLILPGLGPPLPPSFHPHSLVSDFSLGASWAFSFQSVLPPDFRGIMPLTYPTGSVRIS